MDNLGQAILTIDIQVKNLTKSAAQIDRFFSNIRDGVARTNAAFVSLNDIGGKSVAGLSTKLGTLATGFKAAQTSITSGATTLGAFGRSVMAACQPVAALSAKQQAFNSSVERGQRLLNPSLGILQKYRKNINDISSALQEQTGLTNAQLKAGARLTAGQALQAGFNAREIAAFKQFNDARRRQLSLAVEERRILKDNAAERLRTIRQAGRSGAALPILNQGGNAGDARALRLQEDRRIASETAFAQLRRGLQIRAADDQARLERVADARRMAAAISFERFRQGIQARAARQAIEVRNSEAAGRGDRLLNPNIEFQQQLRRDSVDIGRALQRQGASQAEVTAGIAAYRREAIAANNVNRLFNSNTFQLSQGLQQLSFALTNVGRQFLFVGGAIVGAFIPAAIANARFEQSLTETISVLGSFTDVTRGILTDDLADFFLRLGEETKFTATQIADAAGELALAGFSFREIKDSLEDVSNLAASGNVALQDAARISANVGRAFKIDTTNFDRITDVLTAVSTNSNTTVESLGESFKLLAPIASNLGQPLEEVTAAIGLLGTAGIRGSRAGTGLARFFSELLEKSDDLDVALKAVGSSFAAIDPEQVDLQSILDEFVRLQQAGNISTGFFFDNFDQRSARAITTLVNQGSVAFDSLADKARESANEGERIKRQNLDTLAGDYLELTSNLNSLFITLGDNVNGPLREFIQILTTAVRSVTNFVNAFPKTTSFLIQFAVAIGTVTAAIGALVFVAGSLTAVASIGPLLASLTTGLGGVAIAGTGALTAISGFAAALFTFTGGIALVAALGLIVAGFNAISNSVEKAEKAAFVKYRKSLDEASAKTKEFGNDLRELTSQFELLENIGSANALQLNQLFSTEDGETILSPGFLDDQVDAIQSELERQRIKLTRIVDEDFSSRFVQDLVGSKDLVTNFRVVVDTDGTEKLEFFQEFRNSAGDLIRQSVIDIENAFGPLAELGISIQSVFDNLKRTEELRKNANEVRKAFEGGLETLQEQLVIRQSNVKALEAEKAILELAENSDEKALKNVQAKLDQENRFVVILQTQLNTNTQILDQAGLLIQLNRQLSEARDAGNDATAELIIRLINKERDALIALRGEIEKENEARSKATSTIQDQIKTIEELEIARDKAAVANDPIASASFDTRQDLNTFNEDANAAEIALMNSRLRQEIELKNLQDANQNLIDEADRVSESLKKAELAGKATPDSRQIAAFDIEGLKQQREIIEDRIRNAKTGLDQIAKDESDNAANRIKINQLLQDQITREEREALDKIADDQKKRDGDIRKARLRQREELAKANEDLEEQVNARRAILEDELQEQITDLFGTIPSPDSDAFEAGQRTLIDDELNKLREDANKKQTETEEKARDVTADRLAAEKQILDARIGQARSLADFVLITQFLNRLQSSREKQAENAQLRNLSAQRALSTTQAEFESAQNAGTLNNAIRNNLQRAQARVNITQNQQALRFDAAGFRDLGGAFMRGIETLRNSVQKVEIQNLPPVFRQPQQLATNNQLNVSGTINLNADTLADPISARLAQNSDFQNIIIEEVIKRFR